MLVVAHCIGRIGAAVVVVGYGWLRQCVVLGNTATSFLPARELRMLAVLMRNLEG